MKRLLIAVLIMLIIGCNEKPREAAIWQDDFRIQRLPWKTVLGNPNWIMDKGVWVILGEAPFEELAIVDSEWQGSEYQITASLRLNDKGETGVVLGYIDAKNFWRVTLDHSQNRIALIKRENGTDSVRAEGSITLSHREFLTLVVNLTKTLLEVRCNNLIVFQTGSPTGMEGKLGIYTGIASPAGEHIYANYDHFEVKPVP
jgi:hypothetical protein